MTRGAGRQRMKTLRQSEWSRQSLGLSGPAFAIGAAESGNGAPSATARLSAAQRGVSASSSKAQL